MADGLIPAGVVSIYLFVGVDLLCGNREEQIPLCSGLEHTAVIHTADSVHRVEVDPPSDQIPTSVSFAGKLFGTLLDDRRTAKFLAGQWMATAHRGAVGVAARTYLI